MELIHVDYAKKNFKAKITSNQDLWYLRYLIDPGDILKAKTSRKIKLGGDDQRNTRVIRKTVTLAIEVQKVDFIQDMARVSGLIMQGPEDMPIGSHHTINIEENTIFTLTKKQILTYHKEKIEEAKKHVEHHILIVVHDREQAIFARLIQQGFEIIGSISANVSKKADVKIESQDFFAALKKTLLEYDNRYEFEIIIIASPGFWKEYISDKIKQDDIAKKVIYATCSSVSTNGIHEVMKRDEIKKALEQERFTKESSIIEEILTEIAKQGLVEYGWDAVQKAVDLGAVKHLIITESLLLDKKEQDQFAALDHLFNQTEQMQGKVTIISGDHEGTHKLNGIGGIAALLRYAIS